MDSKTRIYIGSLWHQFCDPFVTVAAINGRVCQRILDRAAREEWREMVDNFDVFSCGTDHHGKPCDHAPDNDIMTGGVFADTIGNYKLSDSEIAELQWRGYVYLDIP